MTRQFAKWVSKQLITNAELESALKELKNGTFEASLGGNLYKKRIRFKGRGKSGSGRTIVCYKKGKRAIFIHGFAKNEKSNLSPNEQRAFKETSKILIKLTEKDIKKAIADGVFKEV